MTVCQNTIMLIHREWLKDATLYDLCTYVYQLGFYLQQGGGLWPNACQRFVHNLQLIHLTSAISIRCGHPVEIEQWLSMQNTPQKTRRRSSSSAQSRGGARVGLDSSGGESRWWNPIIALSRTARAQLIAARVNITRRNQVGSVVTLSSILKEACDLVVIG